MTLAIELSPETEARLRASAEARGLDVEVYAAEILEQAVASPATPLKSLSAADMEAFLAEIAQFSDKIPPMPGETFSREMIYQDHD